MEYWGKIKIKIERTDSPAMREIVLETHPTQKNLPKRISTQLSDPGFS